MEADKIESPTGNLLKYRNKAIGIHKFIIAIYAIFGFIMLYVQGSAVMLFILAFPAFIHYMAMLGLEGNKPWGRILSILIGIVLLFGFPFGTIFGVSLLYYLNKKEWHEKN